MNISHPSSDLSIILTPIDRPIVRGVGDTLTLTCTILPQDTVLNTSGVHVPLSAQSDVKVC